MNFPRVLALDHDPDALIALEHALESAGYHTTTTWHVAEALKLLNSGHFEVIPLRRHAKIDTDAFYQQCRDCDCSLLAVDCLYNYEQILHLLTNSARIGKSSIQSFSRRIGQS